jgi:predicted RNase H-like HicB family nuclease
MENHYAALLPTMEGGYLVRFAECPRAFTYGEDLADALENAADVLALEAQVRAEEQREMPPAASFKEVVAFAAASMQEDGIDRSRDFLVRAVPVCGAPA